MDTQTKYNQTKTQVQATCKDISEVSGDESSGESYYALMADLEDNRSQPGRRTKGSRKDASKSNTLREDFRLCLIWGINYG